MSAVAAFLRKRVLPLTVLVLAGEMIFALPFHVPRYFRPSMLETFGLSNAALGDIFAVYGVTAMLAYFPGGMLADRFPARALMALSLLLTALGGAWFATLPGARGLAVLYGYWGVTTILLFWAALIRATRAWGGSAAQGRAFGLLDGGRGLAAAAFAAVAVMVFGHGLPVDAQTLSGGVRAAAMQRVILAYSVVTAIVAGLVWLFGPDAAPAGSRSDAGAAVTNVVGVVREPRVWLLALVVVAAYCGYKGLDNYALYAYDVLGASETEAARFAAAGAWVRPLGAIAAGFVADRVGAARLIALLFAGAAANYAALAGLSPADGGLALIHANLWLSFALVFALRGVYFAVIAEAGIAPRMTGTAVGLVSVIGYTPDVFFAPLAGRVLDAAPGVTGHQHYFLLLAAIALTGLLTAAALAWHIRRQATTED